MDINREFISTNNINGTNNTCKYIIIHETDNTSVGANARAHAKAQYLDNFKDMSVHYYCGSDGIYQAAEHYCQCWHIGKEYGDHEIKDATNNNSLGVEICVNPDGNYTVARENAISLVRYLIKTTGIPASRVIRHFDAKGKYCPRKMMDNPQLWEDFKVAIVKEEKPPAPVGWIFQEGKWWYGHADGSYTKNNWEQIDGKWYFFDENGWMKTSAWQIWNNIWYYLKEDGSMAENNWIQEKEAWYYSKSNGAMAENEWIQDQGKWYYLQQGGVMVVDQILVIQDKKYSFGKDGHLEYTDENGALN